MKFSSNIITSLLATLGTVGLARAFAPGVNKQVSVRADTILKVSVGLGPDAEEDEVVKAADEEVLVEPDHELFRDSRLATFDKQCDDWFGSMLGKDEPSFLGEVSEEAGRRLNTLHKLERNVSLVLKNRCNTYIVLKHFAHQISFSCHVLACL